MLKIFKIKYEKVEIETSIKEVVSLPKAKVFFSLSR